MRIVDTIATVINQYENTDLDLVFPELELLLGLDVFGLKLRDLLLLKEIRTYQLHCIPPN